MNDYMMDLANSHLDMLDKQDAAFAHRPRRFVFDLESLDDVDEAIAKIADIKFASMQDALNALTATLQEAVVIEQYQEGNGTWQNV